MAIPRKQSLKAAEYDKNILRRGMVPASREKHARPFPVGPVALAVVLFVVVGSALLQILSSSKAKGWLAS